jgi:hypothetical protein
VTWSSFLLGEQSSPAHRLLDISHETRFVYSIYHRFTLDERDKIKAMRLFKVSGCSGSAEIYLSQWLTVFVLSIG